MPETRRPTPEDMGLNHLSSPDRAGLQKVSPEARQVGHIMVGKQEAAAAEEDRAKRQESAREAIRDFQRTVERELVALREFVGTPRFEAKHREVQSALDQIAAIATQFNLAGEYNEFITKSEGELKLLAGEHDTKMKLAA